MRREVRQGPATIEVDYASRRVTGRIDAGGQAFPIEIEMDAPAYGDGPALETVIAALPPAESYRASLRVAEVGVQQRLRFFRAEVAGREPLSVPAGEFDAWKVELEPMDGEGGTARLWVSAAAPRAVLRQERRLPPQMGGGTMTLELVSVAD